VPPRERRTPPEFFVLKYAGLRISMQNFMKNLLAYIRWMSSLCGEELSSSG